MGEQNRGLRLLQRPITRVAIGEMLRKLPRRYRIMDKDPLRGPTGSNGSYRLNFRFRETFENLLTTCPAKHRPIQDGSNGEIYAYLAGDTDVIAVKSWLGDMDHFVVCRDLLAVSVALDYDRDGGDPDKPQTLAAQQRKAAKPYDRAPTSEHYAAANHIAAMMVDAMVKMRVYAAADLVMPTPPSSPAKPYDLPMVLAQQIASRTGVQDGTQLIRTTRAREQAKNLSVDDKLDALDGTFDVDAAAVNGRTILLIDDLYQSGATMNFVAMKLHQAGASAILGLAAEKTCRNDDNQPRP